MNAEQCTDAVMQHLGDRMYVAADAYGAELVQDVKTRIDVPVGYSGSRVIRSLPGEPPRRETSEYQRSWTHQTTRQADAIRMSAGTVSHLGPMLEYGTSRMKPRPHVGPAHDQAESVAPDRIKSRL